MEIAELHPSVWAALQARRSRLPHALLFSGQRGLGKFELAAAFAAGLLCEQSAGDGRACGRCLACGWHAQGNHPDFRLVQPDAMAEAESADEEAKESKKKASRQITIDQIRALDDFLSVGTHRAGLRIVLLCPAEAMNRATANALLKTLEEPAADTLFLLVTHEPMRLLPTIRSRCQVVAIPRPDPAVATRWLREAGVDQPGEVLALAGGAPLLANDLAQSGQGEWLAGLVRQLLQGEKIEPLASAAMIDKLLKDSKGRWGLAQIVEWAQKWVVDLALARNGLAVRYFVRHADTMASVVASVPEIRLVRYHRRLLQCRREVEQPLNARLFLEEFF
ncbi:MAG TPA: DNA polymerase III subunit delta', partial [Rhodocyclaceae bacterium]|nr:DNA polymerase III subunit delta' [Rhodocyclaceae bacterium]